MATGGVGEESVTRGAGGLVEWRARGGGKAWRGFKCCHGRECMLGVCTVVSRLFQTCERELPSEAPHVTVRHL
jgi:hypothetical protein